MGVHEGRGRLAESVQQLMRHWNAVQTSWNDAVSQDFEQKHLRPLELDAKSALAGIDRMSAILARIRQDCR
jgi:hypothetical protein